MFRRISRRSLFLMILDTLAVLGAVLCAVRFHAGGWYHEFLLHPLPFLSVVVFLTSFYIFDLYYPFKYFKAGQTGIDVFYSVALGTLVLAAVSYLDRTFSIPRLIFVFAFCLLALFVFLIRLFYDVIFKPRFLKVRSLVIGTGPLAREITQIIRETPYSGIDVSGFVSKDGGTESRQENTAPVLGDIIQLKSLIDRHHIQCVILAMESNDRNLELDLARTLLKQPVKVAGAVHLFEELDGAIPYQALDERYLLGFEAEVRKKSYLKVKRIFDIIFSLLFLVVLSPVFLATAFLLVFEGTGKVFYSQRRIGKGGTPFSLTKFRSMIDGENGGKQISRLGEWLRKYRIDEIPQLFNVLKGDMSLIGPRPEISDYVEQCRSQIPFYDAVFALQPGLTGWAQVKFSHVTDFKDYPRKFSYNLFYLKNVSMALDFLIILKTIRIILLGKGK